MTVRKISTKMSENEICTGYCVLLGQKSEYEHSFGEPGHQQHFELRSLAGHFSGQIHAGHSHHLEVRQQEVNFVFVVSRLLKSLRAAAGAQNLVVAVNQQRRDGIQDVWVVVDHQDRFLIVLWCGCFFHRTISLFPANRSGQFVDSR